MSVKLSSLQKSKVYHKIDALASTVLDNHRSLSGRETSIHKIDEIKMNVKICLIVVYQVFEDWVPLIVDNFLFFKRALRSYLRICSVYTYMQGLNYHF